MKSQPEDEKRLRDEALESRGTTEETPQIPRNKGPARCYFVMMVVIYLALLVMAVVVLASFGIKQADIVKLLTKHGIDSDETCILFAEHKEIGDVNSVLLGCAATCCGD